MRIPVFRILVQNKFSYTHTHTPTLISEFNICAVEFTKKYKHLIFPVTFWPLLADKTEMLTYFNLRNRQPPSDMTTLSQHTRSALCSGCVHVRVLALMKESDRV